MEAFLVTSLLKKELIAQTIGESTKSIFHNIGHVLDDEIPIAKKLRAHIKI